MTTTVFKYRRTLYKEAYLDDSCMKTSATFLLDKNKGFNHNVYVMGRLNIFIEKFKRSKMLYMRLVTRNIS